MTEKSEALRLADALEGRAERAWTRAEAAAELRRLHDHTQMLEHAYKSACDIVEEQDKKLVDLEAVNQELLEAMISFTNSAYIKKHHPKRYAAAVAAIARAEGELNERP
jgi:predicted site-specific integrase-resolvase